jgi:hypothetical protein
MRIGNRQTGKEERKKKAGRESEGKKIRKGNRRTGKEER